MFGQCQSWNIGVDFDTIFETWKRTGPKVCPKMDQSMQLVWNCPSQPLNANTLTIYLKFVYVFHDHLGMFAKCLVENDDVHFFSRTWLLVMNIIAGWRA
jgi:hypothetical protein